MNKSTILLCSCLLWTASAFAIEKNVSSPDGKVVVAVSDEGGAPSYSVTYNGIPFLLKSPLGIETNLGNYTSQMELSSASENQALNETYQLPNIKQSHVEYQANRQVFTFSKDGKKIYDVIFQVSNRDVAFRYKLYPQKQTLCCVVLKEATGFTMPQGTTTFMCPQSRWEVLHGLLQVMKQVILPMMR